MGMNIGSSTGVRDTYQYKTINKNSELYKAAGRDSLSSIIESEMMMTPEQKMLYEMLGGREAVMRTHMSDYDSQGNMLNGFGVAGMSMNGKTLAEAHQIISVPEDWREKMFQETKRHFIQENGVANGDTTRRTEVFTAYQKSTPIDKRLNGTWTLGQYERNYRQAFYDAVKKADPKWELGKPFNSSILDKISREDIDNSLVKASGEYGGTNLVSKGIDIKL